MTMWDTFFMILTVIPASKFLRDIFMKLVARVGGVNEEALAGKGMALLGIGAALAGGGGKMIPGLGGGVPFVTGGNGPIPGGGPGSGLSSGLSTISQSPMLNLPSISQNLGNVGGGYPPIGASITQPAVNTANMTPTGGPFQTSGVAPSSGPGGGNSLPPGYSQNSSGLIVPAGFNSDGGEATTPQTNQSAIQEVFSGEGFHKAGKVGIATGMLSAAGVPGIAPITAGMMGAAAKPVYAATKMAGGLAKETYKQIRDGNGLSSVGAAVKSYTGRESVLGGVASMAGSTAASVFGANAANKVADAFNPSINRIDWKNEMLANGGKGKDISSLYRERTEYPNA